jgi:DNA-binding Xre family transcriptional regulator
MIFSLCLLHNFKSGDNTINAVQNIMKKEHKVFASEKEFLASEFKSKARIIDDKMVEVTAPDGEVFSVLTSTGKYSDVKYRHYELHVIEWIFDLSFSHDKELMTQKIWNGLLFNVVSFMGMSSGNKQGERTRIGKKIRQIREEKGIEAKDLARLTKIDAANLSRIELGKYSVGLDILSKLASALGHHIDIVPKQL